MGHGRHLVGARFPRGAFAGVLTDGDDLFHGADGQTLRHDPGGQVLHGVRVRQGQEGARMARTEHAGSDPALHGWRQLQEADGVGDLRARALDPHREFVLRAPEVGEHLLIGRRLLEGIQLDAVQILQQGIPQEVVILSSSDDRRYCR